MTGHEYTAQTSETPAPEESEKARKKRKREKMKLFWKNVFTKHIGIKVLAIVLAFVLVVLLNV